MPVPQFTDPQGRHISAATVRHMLSSSDPKAALSRRDFAARVGLPADATNEQIFAAVDEAVQAKDARTAEDDLYAQAWGTADATATRAPLATPPVTPSDALYAAAWPGDVDDFDGDRFPTGGAA